MHSDRRKPPHPSPIRRAGAWIAAAIVISATYSCSLIIEGRSEQCQADADCKSGFKCDLSAHVCVGGGSGGSGGSGSSSSSASSSGAMTCDVDGGIQGGGCFGCAPTDDPELLNACTDAQCFPFDNRKRVTALADGGKLPPLPSPDAGP
ncbi:MAG: hypothetical protein QM820_38680 [Minicystis sp.]